MLLCDGKFQEREEPLFVRRGTDEALEGLHPLLTYMLVARNIPGGEGEEGRGRGEGERRESVKSDTKQ